MNEGIREVQKKYCSGALSVAVIIALFLVLVGEKTLAKGLVLGVLFSIVNFVLMGYMLPFRIHPVQKISTVWSFASILLRYGLLIIPIFIAIRNEEFNLAAVVIGLFFIQCIILGERLFLVISSKEKKAM